MQRTIKRLATCDDQKEAKRQGRQPSPTVKPLEQCTNLGALKQVHASIVVNGFNSDYSSIRELIFANTFTIIIGSAQSQNPLNAIVLYTRMESRHSRKDSFTFSFILKACTKLSWVKMDCNASSLFDASEKRDVVPWSALTAGYARRGKVGYAKQGEMESARTLFDEVTKGDVVTWNATIAVYVLCGSNEQAFQMFKEMGLGEKPDVESLQQAQLLLAKG
ncbi:unnamed protein product [Prunus armeniaca]|uniref:Pentatricopeptide repeat-containing protein n=1 Tax=Prunus armeniaca TaxID=36596 RepID=A0A6J5ULJ3_PRUAR|nr:unnamed protein product [Prunus armeniaca]CAB4305391.1 unnamed protein product [Prunus armeniaca]